MTKDPYKYFRIEARELLQGLSQGTLELEKGVGGAETLVRLLRLAHTLKGASRVVKLPEIAELAHAMEDALAPFRGAPGPVSRDATAAVLRQVDQAEQKLRQLEAPAAESKPAAAAVPKPAPLSRRADDGFETVRVEIPEMDALLDSVTEVSTQVSSLRAGLQKLGHARTLAGALREQLSSPGASRRDELMDGLRREIQDAQRLLSVDIDQVESRIGRIHEDATRMRLVPAAAILPMLERAVRDAAQSVQRAVQFQSAGGDHRLDASVLGTLRDALLHVVRNAVAHGIEPEADRVAAGKPAAGRVQVTVERRGSRVAFLCSDDGRGIDVDAVRAAAVKQGVIAPAEAQKIGLQDAVQLLLKGGLTTTGSVTELSGRGIGLDVLRDAVARLKGELAVRSERGRGTVIEIVVPVSLSSQAVLAVESAGSRMSIPLDSVAANLLLAPSEIVRSGERDTIRHDGRMIPLASLASVLGRPAPARRDQAVAAVIVRAGGAEAAVVVDHVLGATRAVVRTVPAAAQAQPVVCGASLNTEGDPELVLDPAGLIDAVRSGSAPAAPAPGFDRRPILVIDDSLTTRMLEQSILESAGYSVDLAVSGEDGLAKARERRYGLFICDVEMPGMNGFEFVTRAKADAALKDVPAILVTSLASPEDKSRGKRAGARAYIVKSEFDQGSFMQIIRGLVE
jgi:two-component system, chemotaxis family, sensor kinase CheA